MGCLRLCFLDVKPVQSPAEFVVVLVCAEESSCDILGTSKIKSFETKQPVVCAVGAHARPAYMATRTLDVRARPSTPVCPCWPAKMKMKMKMKALPGTPS